MAADDSEIGLVRKHRWTAITILLVALLVVLLLVGAITVIGMVGSDDAEADPELSAARFTITETNATITDYGGEETRTVVEVAFRGGTDVLQDRVEIRVNDRPAWGVRRNDDGYNETASVWDDSTDPVSASPARIVLYGENMGGEDIESRDVSDRYSYIGEGDVVEIVWYSDDGETMTVLQRYEIG